LNLLCCMIININDSAEYHAASRAAPEG
jgi:hypothetical protein